MSCYLVIFYFFSLKTEFPSSAESHAPLFIVDESLPYTTIQIRLHNGEKVTAKFNTSHTINDIKQWLQRCGPLLINNCQKFTMSSFILISICSKYPDMNNEYQLMLSYPRKALSDTTQTIQQANLLNAVIIQNYYK